MKKIKKRNLPDILHAARSHQKRVIKEANIETVLSKTAGILKCDMDLCRESIRISKSVKADSYPCSPQLENSIAKLQQDIYYLSQRLEQLKIMIDNQYRK